MLIGSKKGRNQRNINAFYKNQFSAVGTGSGTIMFELQKKIIELNGKINLKEGLLILTIRQFNR